MRAMLFFTNPLQNISLLLVTIAGGWNLQAQQPDPSVLQEPAAAAPLAGSQTPDIQQSVQQAQNVIDALIQPVGETGFQSLGTPAAASAGDAAPAAESGQQLALDPGSEVISYNGKIWQVTNQRMFRATFENYLNGQAQSDAEAEAYREVIEQILSLLKPGARSSKNIDSAWELLAQAAQYPIDGGFSASLADAVYSVWDAKAERNRLQNANRVITQELERTTWNMEFEVQDEETKGSMPRNEEEAKAWLEARKQEQEIRMRPLKRRLERLEEKEQSNYLKADMTELQAKAQMQTLMLQFFLQRRFEHVEMSNRFYRSLFGDGDHQLHVGEDAKGILARSAGFSPTIGVLDTMNREAIQRVQRGVDSYLFLMENRELNAATERLAEAFIIGEHLPVMRELSREKKRRGFEYIKLNNRLLTAIEVKDYTEAEKLIQTLKEMATDFDATRATAAVETAKTVGNAHLAKAKTAAMRGDTVTAEAELAAAMAIWPRNPRLSEFVTTMVSETDVQQKALTQFNAWLEEKEFRKIFDNRARFIAAAAAHPEIQSELEKVLELMQEVELKLAQSEELEKRGDHAGAWESIEMALPLFPEDRKLIHRHSMLTTKAMDFVQLIRQGQEMEQRGETGSGLAWYLHAIRVYPGSELGKEAVRRLGDQILYPEHAVSQITTSDPEFTE